jgi:hypothetical protein
MPKKDVQNLGSRPIRHEKLSPECEKVARYTYKVVGSLLKPTYEQWELDFLRNIYPERELSLWILIADAFPKAVKDHPEMDRKAVVDDLVAVSHGADSRLGLKDYYAAAWQKYQQE